MRSNHDDFIGVYEDAYSKQFCKDIINYFELSHKNGNTYTRQQTEKVAKTKKNDISLEFAFYLNSVEPNLYKQFNDIFWSVGYKEYSETFDILNNYPPHKIFYTKIQKTNPTGGYHVWHAENQGSEVTTRLLTFILYLNDVKEGGETEFLYLSRRVKPKAGTLVIWPASFTHTHRGNPPLSGSKYILTGWVEM